MHAQLQQVLTEMNGAVARLRELVAATTEEEWTRRPTVEGWSAAECVEHLNMTSRAMIPLLQEGLDRAARAGGTSPHQFRRDPMGWLIWKASNPQGRMRAPTGRGFVPAELPPRRIAVAEFERLQAEQVECIRRGDGLPLHRVKIASPFNPKVRYSLYSAFTIIAAHEHRHLGQAERAVRRG